MAVIIDPNTIEELETTLGADFVKELIDTYRAETPKLLDQLCQALSQGDAVAFQRAAHSIKSSSASLGALEFSAQAKELEMLGKQGDLSQADEKVAGLSAQYSQVEQALLSLKANA